MNRPGAPAAMLLALAALFAPLASAGSQDAPELTDDAADCEFALGNEYADIGAAWISDETATDFRVNLALNKWTLDHLAEFTGYTVQFQHQGVQFGVAAVFFQGEWEFSNGYIDLETGETSNFTDAEGSFTPGTPAVLSIAFDKAHFPHGDAADNQLRAFVAGTADFKYYVPWGIADQQPPVDAPFFFCDYAESAATYTFGVGGHSLHDMGSAAAGNATEAGGAANATSEGAADESAALAQQSGSGGGNDTPGLALPLVVAAALVAVVASRRRLI